MKWHWETLFGYVYSRYVNLIKKHNKFVKDSTIIMGDWGEEKPTQSDKPSAHSSLSRHDAIVKLKKMFPAFRGYVIATVQNKNSMEPFIDENSILALEEITDERLKIQPLVKGDICVYVRERDGANIVHRIKKVSRTGQNFQFKGDNNFVVDGWINIEHIKYRYIGQLQHKQLKEGD